MMPPLEYMDLTDRAVYWEVTRWDREGMPLVLAPVEIPVRWEETQIEMLGADGQKVSVDASIATNRNLKIDSIIWEGSLEDLAEEEAGTGYIPTSDVYQVVMRDRGKDLKGRVTRYEFGLKRFKDRLPERV